MNYLSIPKKTIIGELKDAFNYQKRAMSSTWLWASLLLGLYVFFVLIVSLGLFVSFILPLSSGVSSSALYSNIMVCSTVAGIIYFIMKAIGTRHFRSKIMADMESAEPSTEACIFAWYSINSGTEYLSIVPTMAGDLKFVTCHLSYLEIEKKVGKLYSYYVYKDVENLDQKDLRKFVVVNNESRIQKKIKIKKFGDWDWRIKILGPVVYTSVISGFFAYDYLQESSQLKLLGLILIIFGYILMLVARVQLRDKFSIFPELKRGFATRGMYRVIRNPTYFFSSMAAVGILFCLFGSNVWWDMLIFMFMALYIIMQVNRAYTRDERFLAASYKEEYKKYMEKTWF